jgi:hypothetical protein
MVEEMESAAGRALETWADLSEHERIETFEHLPRKEAATFFLDLSSRDELELLLAMPERERRIWLRLLAPDDAADVIQLAPDHERRSLLNLLDDIARREVSALLAYKEDEAGGLMSPRFARLRPEMTVDEAIRYLRRQAARIETVYYAYVLDDSTETAAIRNTFGAHACKLLVSSTKSMHGHTLGAAGAIEGAATVLALKHQTVPPTANFTTPDPACDLDVVPNEAKQASFEYALSNSFAFGGLNAVVVFRAV